MLKHIIVCPTIFCSILVSVFSLVAIIYATMMIYIPADLEMKTKVKGPFKCTTTKVDFNVGNCSWWSCADWCLNKVKSHNSGSWHLLPQTHNRASSKKVEDLINSPESGFSIWKLLQKSCSNFSREIKAVKSWTEQIRCVFTNFFRVISWSW